jgi:DNA-binding beta-propeller fold protein YncE
MEYPGINEIQNNGFGSIALILLVCIPMIGNSQIGGPDKILEESPTNLGYTNVSNWLQFPPPGHPDWEFDGVVAGVGVDSKDNVYVSHRGDKAPRLTVWKPDGSLLRVFPGPETVRPHFVELDKHDNVWWVDDGGDCIYKMDQQAKILMILGECGTEGDDEYHFSGVSDIGWDLDGNLYVTDGDRHNRRVLKYDKDGKFIKTWGSKGQEPGQFDYPHSILVDSKETVFVCDRNNYRIQVFDKDGKQEANWTHIGRVYQIVEDKYGDYFVSDGFAARITKFKRDGTVIGFFDTRDIEPGERGSLNNAHSMAIDSKGNLYTGTYQGWVERWQAPDAESVAWNRIWKPDSTSEFEVGTQIRPWTIHDEGMTYILDNMQSMAGVNNLYIIVVMHEEHRPFQSPEFPHNPARDIFDAEDSRVSFYPEMERYGKIKPLLSDHEWIREKDWLRLVIDSCRARGLSVGAEVSHFPIPKSLIRENPDLQQKTIDGKAWNTGRFCPNNLDAREYVVALFGDIAANYDVDYIQTCQLIYNNLDIDEGGTCFCRHCIAAAKGSGFDLEAAIPVLKKDKNAQSERDNWIAFRTNSTTELYRLIAEKIREENPGCHLRFNDVLPWSGGDAIEYGMDMEAVAPYLGSLVNQDHQEQLGRENENFEKRKKWLADNRRFIGPEIHYVSGIAARMAASPELVRAGIKVVLEHPARVDGLALKHYDGASFSLLRAFKQGMIEAGVVGLPPTLGKEVEEMELDGYSPFQEELVEEWGVETSGTGIATYSFDEPSGAYDIRITYFDQEEGQSQVNLYIAGEEKATFKMDEDTDCWRWRMFKKIQVNEGDEIKLVGKAHNKEQAKLDFIEFIPRKTQ